MILNNRKQQQTKRNKTKIKTKIKQNKLIYKYKNK